LPPPSQREGGGYEAVSPLPFGRGNTRYIPPLPFGKRRILSLYLPPSPWEGGESKRGDGSKVCFCSKYLAQKPKDKLK